MIFFLHISQSGHKAAKCILCLLTLFISSYTISVVAQNKQHVKTTKPAKPYEPVIPQANRYQANKVFLERADSMLSAPVENPANSYILLMGNIEFSRGDMHLFCDSAHYYDQINSIDAFGNVRMERGDGLSGRADQLHYNGSTEVMNLVGNVSITKDNRTLSSQAIDYYVPTNVGKYESNGRLEDPKNVLTSIVGEYNFNTDNAVFSNNVDLVNSKDNYNMHTNKLLYNTRTNIATLVEATDIISDENKIVTSSGNYNTDSEVANLYVKNGVQPILYAKDDRTLEGDTIHYERVSGEGTARGNVRVVDPKHQAILTGGFGYHNEKTNVSYATDRALARIYNKEDAKQGERSDTLFFHGDTITTIQEADKKRVLTATGGVKFYRKDVQGICGNLSFAQRDSILYLYNHPVVWSGERQISSDNEISVHMRDSSSVDWALIPNKGLIVEHLGEIYYNQISGRYMKAFFEKSTQYFDDGTQSSKNELRHADVEGNVKTLFYPMENDSTYNKCVRTESGFLSIDLKPGQEVDKVKMWPEVSGTVIPLYIAKKAQLRLDEYQWFDDLRPKQPYEVLNISEEMRHMISLPYEKSSPQEEEKPLDDDRYIDPDEQSL